MQAAIITRLETAFLQMVSQSSVTWVCSMTARDP